MICEYAKHQDQTCDCKGEVAVHEAMTAYHFEGCPNSPGDPNRDLTLCEAHWEEYRAHWQSMWDEYNGIIQDNVSTALSDMAMERRENELQWEMEQEQRQLEIEADEYQRECNRRYEDGDY